MSKICALRDYIRWRSHKVQTTPTRWSSLVTKKWAGFIKIDLKKLQVDGLALLKGTWAFALELEEGEKGYELITQTQNLCLYLKGDSLMDTQAHTLFCTLVREGHYEGKQLEFMSLTKPDITKDFAFFTIISEEVRDGILNQRLTYQRKRIHMSITKGKWPHHLSSV